MNCPVRYGSRLKTDHLTPAAQPFIVRSFLKASLPFIFHPFLIQYNETLSMQDFKGMSWMAAIFKILAAILRSKVISGGVDDTAIVLYNTKQQNSANGIEEIYVLQDLGESTVERIMELDSYTGTLLSMLI